MKSEKQIFKKQKGRRSAKLRERRNLCVFLLRETKKSYCSTLNEKNLIDNRKFWKTVKPMLSNKLVSSEKFTLVENKKIITDDREIAKTLNEFFLITSNTLNNPNKS